MGDVTAIIGATRKTAVYSAPWLTANALPADSLAFGTTWGANWVDRGFTQAGTELGIAVERAEINVDQVLDMVLYPITSRTVTLRTMLAQMSAINLQLGAGQGSITTVAPGAGTRGHDDWDLSAAVSDSFNSWGLDCQNDGDAEPFRVFVPKGLAIDGTTSRFGDPTTNAQVPMNIQAMPDTSTTPTRILKVRDIIPALP